MWWGHKSALLAQAAALWKLALVVLLEKEPGIGWQRWKPLLKGQITYWQQVTGSQHIVFGCSFYFLHVIVSSATSLHTIYFPCCFPFKKQILHSFLFSLFFYF